MEVLLYRFLSDFLSGQKREALSEVRRHHRVRVIDLGTLAP